MPALNSLINIIRTLSRKARINTLKGENYGKEENTDNHYRRYNIHESRI